MSCLVCGVNCECKPGNPYPAIYREREAMRDEFVRARLESPLAEVKRIEYWANRDFMEMARSLTRGRS